MGGAKAILDTANKQQASSDFSCLRTWLPLTASSALLLPLIECAELVCLVFFGALLLQDAVSSMVRRSEGCCLPFELRGSTAAILLVGPVLARLGKESGRQRSLAAQWRPRLSGGQRQRPAAAAAVALASRTARGDLAVELASSLVRSLRLSQHAGPSAVCRLY